MNKDHPVGFVLKAELAFKFFERVGEAEKAFGKELTREEREHLLAAMMKGKELTLEELQDMMAGKRILIIKGKDSDIKNDQ